MEFEDPRAWALRVLAEASAKIAASDVELVVYAVPQLEQLQRIVRMPGFGPADGADGPL